MAEHCADRKLHVLLCLAWCIMSHCCNAACAAIWFARVILLFHCHAALPQSYTLFFPVLRCFDFVMLLYPCHACCFAFILLLCNCHVALLLSNCFASVMQLKWLIGVVRGCGHANSTYLAYSSKRALAYTLNTVASNLKSLFHIESSTENCLVLEQHFPVLEWWLLSAGVTLPSVGIMLLSAGITSPSAGITFSSAEIMLWPKQSFVKFHWLMGTSLVAVCHQATTTSSTTIFCSLLDLGESWHSYFASE